MNQCMLRIIIAVLLVACIAGCSTAGVLDDGATISSYSGNNTSVDSLLYKATIERIEYKAQDIVECLFTDYNAYVNYIREAGIDQNNKYNGEFFAKHVLLLCEFSAIASSVDSVRLSEQGSNFIVNADVVSPLSTQLNNFRIYVEVDREAYMGQNGVAINY